MTQERARRTRALLVDAAAEEFAHCGYAAASINRIVDNSTSTKGALYFHFPSKQALAEAVLADARAVYTVVVDRWQSGDVHPVDAIAGIADDIAAAVIAHTVVRAETRLTIDHPPAGLQRPSQVWESAVRELADTADREGCFRRGFTAARFTNFLLASLAGHRFLADIMPSAALSELPARYADTVAVALAAAATPEYLQSRGVPEKSGKRTTSVLAAGSTPAVAAGRKDEVGAP